MDTLFHYYGSYLAARLAGMEQDMAQRLAYYCYGMTELKAGSEAVKQWQFAGLGDDGSDRAFSPCVVLSDDSCGQYGMHNCKLAFTQLPCLSFGVGRANGAVNLDFRSGQTLTNEVAAKQSAQVASRFAYNPLTDIDWRGGGEVKPSFGRKIAEKLGRLRRQSSHLSAEHSQGGEVQSHYFDPRLSCVANSDFARKMMNDAIDKKNKTAGLDPLALFACRLFVYQQTWMQPRSQAHSKATSAQTMSADNDKVQAYLAMFYWTAYAIQSFMTSKPLGDKLRIRLLSDGSKVELLNSVLRSIFIFEGNKLEKEYFYLSRLACILSYGEVKQKPQHDSWYQGFRFRPRFLFEKALIASGGGCSREIQFLSAFKQSEFYHLNKAAQAHCMWVDEQLEQAGLAEFSTAQYCHF